MEIIELQTNSEDIGKRLDAYLCEAIDGLSRNAVQGLIADKKVTMNDLPLKKNYKIGGGERLKVEIPAPQVTDILPENIPLDLVYEDQDIIVVNKVRGMVVHPAVGNWTGTLVNALLYHCGERLSGINGEIRPGIVHRIDKDTSGLLVVAKNDAAHQALAAQIAEHFVKREYEAIVCGTVRDDQGTIDKPIGRHKTDRKKMAICPDGRNAITHYTVLGRYRGYTHMAFKLETGRTHQIRVHMASIGHPIIGDPLYGAKNDKFKQIGGQCLHAAHLTLTHPRTGELMTFHATRPEYFEKILQSLPI